MCRASTVTDDWVVKGCHIHVDGIELGVCPTHSPDYLDGILFKKIFRSTPDAAFHAAAKKAREQCLGNAMIRGRWRLALERGIQYVRTFEGEPAEKANGRQYEFLRLLWNLDAYEERHGNTRAILADG